MSIDINSLLVQVMFRIFFTFAEFWFSAAHQNFNSTCILLIFIIQNELIQCLLHVLIHYFFLSHTWLVLTQTDLTHTWLVLILSLNLCWLILVSVISEIQKSQQKRDSPTLEAGCGDPPKVLSAAAPWPRGLPRSGGEVGEGGQDRW